MLVSWMATYLHSYKQFLAPVILTLLKMDSRHRAQAQDKRSPTISREGTCQHHANNLDEFGMQTYCIQRRSANEILHISNVEIRKNTHRESY
jgi:hypothetical protein